MNGQHPCEDSQAELIWCSGMFGAGDGAGCWLTPAAIKVYERLMGLGVEKPSLPPKLMLVPKLGNGGA